MKVSPYAGKPAEASMLVNVPRLVTAYYAEQPDPSGTEDIYKIYAESFRGADHLRRIGSLRFGDLRVETNADHHVFQVEIYLNNLDPNAARVELYADGIGGGDPVRVEMKCARPQPDASRRCVYHATVPTTRPARDYTARVVPQRSGVAVPLESARILWQR